jgi:tRNA A37 threonylcarbamoyladenosine synthetase subunit TsaC/SUA5/YrdC
LIMVVEGRVPGQPGSTIVDASGARAVVLRPGVLALDRMD